MKPVEAPSRRRDPIREARRRGFAYVIIKGWPKFLQEMGRDYPDEH